MQYTLYTIGELLTIGVELFAVAPSIACGLIAGVAELN